MSRSNRDHAKKQHCPIAEDEAIASQLEALLTPEIISQESYYRSMCEYRFYEKSVDGATKIDQSACHNGHGEGKRIYS